MPPLKYRLSVNIGETCTATCASYGVGCVEGAFPTTICQGAYVQAASPHLATSFVGYPPGCDYRGLNYDKMLPCEGKWD